MNETKKKNSSKSLRTIESELSGNIKSGVNKAKEEELLTIDNKGKEIEEEINEANYNSTAEPVNIKIKRKKRRGSQRKLEEEMQNFNSADSPAVRRDYYGNVIKRGGRQRVTFVDKVKSQKLVQIVDFQKTRIKGQESSKEKVNCNCACFIF